MYPFTPRAARELARSCLRSASAREHAIGARWRAQGLPTVSVAQARWAGEVAPSLIGPPICCTKRRSLASAPLSVSWTQRISRAETLRSSSGPNSRSRALRGLPLSPQITSSHRSSTSLSGTRLASRSTFATWSTACTTSAMLSTLHSLTRRR